MTSDEIENKLASHDHKLEEHDFVIKTIKDLSGKIVLDLDSMLLRMEDISRKQQDYHTMVCRKFDAMDATIKMQHNTMNVELANIDMRFMDIDRTIRIRAAEAGLRFDALESRIDSIEAKVAAHDLRFDAIDKRLDEHDKRFDAIDKRLDEHDKRFDAIDKRLDEHDKRFDAIDKRLDEHDKRFDEHDKRFDKLDRELADIKQLIMERLPAPK